MLKTGKLKNIIKSGVSVMQSDIDIVVTQSKILEALLEQKFGATGRGLHEKIN
ncbi:MAG: hypothetical protein U1F01_00975 [Acinetobacter sp.]